MWLVVIDQWSSEPGRLTLVYNSSFLHRDVSLKLYLQSQNLYKLKYSTEFSSFINHSLSFYSRHVERHMACADCFKVIIFWEKQFMKNGTFTNFWFLGPRNWLMIHLLGGGGGSLNELPNFRNEGLDRTSIFRGSWWERGGWPFSGGVSFYIKVKLKSQIFGAWYLMTKKFINKNGLLCHNQKFELGNFN